jgi:hypothetical protein
MLIAFQGGDQGSDGFPPLIEALEGAAADDIGS